MHFICIYLLALLHIFEYTKKTELYPAIGKEELFQMLYSQNKKRGFTLVELIVVLVILAILAALLIPALTGYIDKAKKDQVIAETRMLHEAVQTEMVEIYGSNAAWKQQNLSTLASDRSTPIDGGQFLGSQTDAKNRYDEIAKLAEIPSSAKFLILVNGQAKIHAITIIPVAAISAYIFRIHSSMLHISSAQPQSTARLMILPTATTITARYFIIGQSMRPVMKTVNIMIPMRIGGPA